ncbi:MAG TPA: DUF3471 domain-containing protein, partial [Longimicrobiales bacterium]|nr:DUF3471 domain-containing protein [Longimicrobiales bacterium]
LVEVPYRNLDNVAPAGSINSSAAEMAEWLKLLLADGVAAGDTLIRPATLEEIFTPHTLRAAPADTLFPAVNFSGYGLGIGIQDYRGRKALVHTGGIDGMLSMVGLLPELDLGVVVLTSVTERNNLFTALVYSVFDRYLAAQGVDVSPVRDWSQALLTRQAEQRERAERAQREAEAATVSGTEPSRALELYTGTYRHPMYGDATVSLEGGRLVLRRGPAFVGDLEHHHFNTFRADWRAAGLGSALVTFGLDFTGRPARLDVDGFDTFRRVDDDSSS